MEFYRKMNMLLIEDAKPVMRSPGPGKKSIVTRKLNHDTSYMSLTNETDLQQNIEINNHTEPAEVKMGIS